MARTKTVSDGDVVRATRRVLTRLGPARFTLADVAAESGLAPATLLQRFGSKRGLLLANARAGVAEASAPFDRARRKLESPLGALRAALSTACQGLRTRQEIANGLAVLLDDLTDDEMRAAAAEHAATTERAIRGLLEEATGAGELSGADEAELAVCIYAAYNGAIIQWALRGQGTFEAMLERVLAPLLPVKPRRRAPARRRRAGRAKKARSA